MTETAVPNATKRPADDGVDKRRDNPGRGVAFMLAGVTVFAVQDAAVKWLVADYPVVEVLFFRAVFGLIPCMVIVHRAGGLKTVRTRRPVAHLMRTGLILGALLFFFLAVRAMPLADAIAISFSAPLFMTALSRPLLGERVGARRWAAVVAGFVGVLIIARPGAGVLEAGAVLALVSSLLFAIGTVFTRRMVRDESSAAIVVYFSLTAVLVCAVFLPFAWVTPSLPHALMLAGVGVLGGIGAFCMVEAVRFAPVAVIAPLEYAALVWAILFGFLVWGDVPGTGVVVGAAVVIASNLYILRREARRREGGSAPRHRVRARPP